MNKASSLKKNTFYKVDIVVIGAGQAGLSAAYYLQKFGIEAGKGFVVLDDEKGSGGAWQHRWDSLTLENVNGINDLPGLSFEEAMKENPEAIRANQAVPAYYSKYEKTFHLPIIRTVKVLNIKEQKDRFLIETNGVQFSARGIVNATGTWKTPNIPHLPGSESFKGLQLHTKTYKKAEDFRGKHVIVVGAGISAVQLLGELSKVTTTTWVTRRPPDFRPYEFNPEHGREAVAMVDERVRLGLPPKSVVSVTGLPITPAIEEMLNNGIMDRLPMFTEITANGVRWEDGQEMKADVIFWNTGFKQNIDHLKELNLVSEKGGVVMAGKAATQVQKDPRIHLTGYGPSTSTIGANRAGRAVAREIIATLGLKKV